ncbi:M48 family metallopeptidase [Patescibacteria group bacterium]|nr:M48 family metallopeptidase [Patescibacteria group bacterium]
MFNRKLTQFPLFVLDYVVIHELAHLVHFNHSPKFRSLVEKYCPDYKKAKKRLREHER